MNKGIPMKTIKESDLKKIFDAYGLDEGIFDIFKKMRLRKNIDKIDNEIDSKIEKVKNPQQKDAIRKLQQSFRKAHSLGVI